MEAIHYYANPKDSPVSQWYSSIGDLNNKKVPHSLAKSIKTLTGRTYLRKGVLVDLGGGVGSSAYHFVNELPVKKCIIVDGADVLLEYAKSKKDNFSSDLYVQQKNLCADDLDLDTDSANITISCNVMYYLRNIDKVFSEASRILKKGGWFGFNLHVFADHKQLVRVSTVEISEEVEIATFLYQEKYIRSLCSKYHFAEISTENLGLFVERSLDLQFIEKLILLKRK